METVQRSEHGWSFAIIGSTEWLLSYGIGAELKDRENIKVA